MEALLQIPKPPMKIVDSMAMWTSIHHARSAKETSAKKEEAIHRVPSRGNLDSCGRYSNIEPLPMGCIVVPFIFGITL